MSDTASEGATEIETEAKDTPDASVDPVGVKVYVVTGTENLRLPESFCKECNLFVNAVESAAETIDVPVDVNVYSWWRRFPGALRHGGYHPPVMVVGGKRLCQGHHVPSEDEVIGAVRDAVDRRESG
jgi:hypothetical protein